jgi:uncharacterized protein (TIGR02246 family)
MFRLSKSVALFASAVFLVVTALALSSCAPSHEKQPASATDIRAEVRPLFDTYVGALNRSDSTAISSVFAPDAEVTVAGRERFFRGQEAIGRAARESLRSPGQNTFEIDTLDVVPIERVHALALAVYTVEPSDQDIPAFHITGTYVLEKSGAKWHIVHAHVCPAREL